MLFELLNEVMLAFQVASKRVKCPPGTLSEGQIVSALFSNYTKMLPEGDSAVEVQIEMHVQVSSILRRVSHAQLQPSNKLPERDIASRLCKVLSPRQAISAISGVPRCIVT